VAVHALYGTTPQPLLAMLASGKTLKSCPEHLSAKADVNRAISETHVVSPRAGRYFRPQNLAAQMLI